MNSDGTDMTAITDEMQNLTSPVWAPQGGGIAFQAWSRYAKNQNIYVVNSDGSGLLQVTDNPATDHTPVWPPAGDWLGFISAIDGNIYAVSVSGGNPIKLTNVPS